MTSTTLTTERLDYALAYARLGWRIFPAHSAHDGRCSCGDPGCRSIGKHPRIDRWQIQATDDERRIHLWWEDLWPDANLALVLGDGLIDLEDDPRHDGDVHLPHLEAILGPLPDTVSWTSGGGGTHRLYTVPPGVRVRCRTDLGRDLLGLGPDGRSGVDCKADGGYAIVPPSSHAFGTRYRFGNLNPTDIDCAPLPDAWLAYLTQEPASLTSDPAASDAIIVAGRRNNTLTRYAGHLRRCGMDVDEIAAALAAINAGRCRPPLDAAEVQRIAASVGRYEPDQVTQAVVEDWAATTLEGGPRTLAFQWFRDTTERKPDWLWKGYLVRHTTAVLGGRQGSSKGLFTVDLAARLSRGDDMPDGQPGGPPVKVLIVTREDDPEMTLLPRLRVAGADLDHVAWSRGDFSDEVPIATMADAADHIADLIRTHGFQLVIIDPIGAWVEDDVNNGQQVRAVIDPMNRGAYQTGCCILFVAHLRKAPAEDPMDAFAGSVQVTAACRVGMLITPTNGRAERFLRVVKTNFREPDNALLYRFVTASDDPDDPPALAWRPATEEDLAIAAATNPSITAIIPVAAVLEHLSDQHRPLKDAARAIRKTLMPRHRGLTIQAVTEALLEAIASGEAHEGRDENGARTVGRLPAEPVATASDRAIAYWLDHPQDTVRAVAEAIGCSASLAGKARKLAFPAPQEPANACPPPLSTSSVHPK